MMTSAQALAIYQAGPETVVRVLLEMDARIDALIATNEKLMRDFTARIEVSESGSSSWKTSWPRTRATAASRLPAMGSTGPRPRA